MNILPYEGLQHTRTAGGHEVWSKQGLTRPVTFQTHIDPVPEFIVRNNFRTMGVTVKDFEAFIISPVGQRQK